MASTPEQWQRIKELFDAAVELPAANREPFLAERCSDEELRREVLTLLRADSEAPTGFLAQPPDAATVLEQLTDPLLGTELGSYRVVRELARGGMGKVYLGERTDAYQKRVAIKVVKRGMDTDDVVRRFRDERQLLARLEHPNIARILDGGATADGLPYLVMDYIDGEPIDQWVAVHELRIEQRLALFLDVCGAVAYAHRNLVVHRDLKPANIVVSGGVPVLLDFGIAKVLDPALTGATVSPTGLGMAPMTPEYASPEQLRGGPITTSTDVYSLGIILHELLTGRRLSKVAALDAETLLRLATEDVPLPSAVAPAEIARRLKGDLDTIALRALEKDPARRYASVEALADDVRRHLQGLPIHARADRWTYRTGKFVRRHRLGVGVAVVLAVVVSGAVAVVFQQRGRAERQRAIATDAANTMVLQVADAMTRMSGPTEARLKLLAQALPVFDRIQAEGDDRELRLRIAETNRSLAQTYADLGDAPHAAERVQRAAALLQPLVDRNEATPAELSTYASVEMERGDLLLLLNRGGESNAAYDRGIGVLRRASARPDATLNLRSTYALALTRKGDRLFAEGNYAAAERLFTDARGILKTLTAIAPRNTIIGSRHAMAVERVADCRFYSGHTAESCVEYRHALTLRERLVALQPASTNLLSGVAIANQNCGYCAEEAGDIPAAIALYRKGIEVQRRLVADDPSNIVRIRGLMGGLAQLAGTYQRAAQYGDALALLDEAAGVTAAYRAKYGVAPPVVVSAANNALVRAETLSKLGRHEEAERALAGALADFELLRQKDPQNVDRVRDVFSVEMSLVSSARRRNDREAANAHAVRGVELARQVARSGAATDTHELARSLHELATELLAGGDPAAAMIAAEEGRRLLLAMKERGTLDPASQAARVYLPALEALLARLR
jgi:tetratricopeptide (TPR) repeat protein/predicted Ser/Thr protein kinase